MLGLGTGPERDPALEHRTLLRGSKFLDHQFHAGLPLIRIVSLIRHVDERSRPMQTAMYRIEQVNWSSDSPGETTRRVRCGKMTEVTAAERLCDRGVRRSADR
jgi:hypothetical protein